MDFNLNEDQSAVHDAMSTLLARHAGPLRLRELGGDEPTYDHELERHLEAAGFLDLAGHGSTNRLDAALVQEAISLALGTVATSSRLLIAPSLPEAIKGPVSVIAAGHRGPARFAADAVALIVIGDHEVRFVAPPPAPVERVVSRLGWPVGQLDDVPHGDVMIDVDPAEVLAWARIAIAIELVGAMRFATDMAVGYVTERKQFNRALGSFQAVQHGLAECAVAVEGARWLSLEAAHNGTPEAAAAALTHAIQATKVVFPRTHQYCGAMGFTQEFDLHLATMRVVALRAEGEALGRPGMALARQRWASLSS
ncbi:MAG: acyl-CoA dehydrogenase [Actinomycetia bacterium]|nr:acyl-CoA dehydrogenase [Actinomycetes bacterium]